MIAGSELEVLPRPVSREVSSREISAETLHIAVVDDEVEIREMIGEYLDMKGFRVSCADGGRALRALLEVDSVDLVLLDVSMPEEDGLSIARYLKANTDAAVVMVTAAGDVVDRIIGLEMGADDYLAKPVDLRELHARIKAVLRRRAPRLRDDPVDNNTQGVVPFGDCQLDLETHRLRDADGIDIPITSMEFELLSAFARHPNRVLNRDQLLDMAHNRDWEPFDRSIDIRIARLRRKVEPDPTKPQIIKTVRGAGYLFAMARRG